MIATRHTNVRSDCSYKRRVSVRRKRVKQAKRLKVVLIFLPTQGSDLARTRIVYKTRIR